MTAQLFQNVNVISWILPCQETTLRV